MTQETFHSAFKRLGVTGITRLDLEEDLFLRWNITSLTFLHLSQNNITKIWQRAFYRLVYLEELDPGKPFLANSTIHLKLETPISFSDNIINTMPRPS
jgi:hypothetical protein